jgi:hypothetical protein
MLSNVKMLGEISGFHGCDCEDVFWDVAIEVRKGRNFRLSPGPRCIFIYVIRTPPKPDFLLFQPE